MRHAALVLSMLALACSRNAAAPVAESQPARAAAPASVAQAATATSDAGQQLASVSGSVVETLDSGGYTYLLLRTTGGDVWAAVNQASVKKGASVAVVNAALMTGFQSKTLNRTFDRIYFGSLGSGAAPPAAAGGRPAADDAQLAANMVAQHAAAASGPDDVGEIKVQKAEGPSGKTVAEVWAGKASLKEKEIAVRGKVVKYNAGIMGRNWVHLRDGTGARASQDDDITVTTVDKAALGDVVLVRGIVRLDRDFGAGYVYPVILEDARLQK